MGSWRQELVLAVLKGVASQCATHQDGPQSRAGSRAFVGSAAPSPACLWNKSVKLYVHLSIALYSQLWGKRVFNFLLNHSEASSSSLHTHVYRIFRRFHLAKVKLCICDTSPHFQLSPTSWSSSFYFLILWIWLLDIAWKWNQFVSSMSCDPLPFQGRIISTVWMDQYLYPLICWLTIWRLQPLDYWEYCCSEQRCASEHLSEILFPILSGVHSQVGIARLDGNSSFNFLRNFQLVFHCSHIIFYSLQHI
jgi:hypothetical protein